MTSMNKRPAKKQKIGTHHGWVMTAPSDNIQSFVAYCESLALEEEINIAVVGDEISAYAKEQAAKTGTDPMHHAQAFINFPRGRGKAFGTIKKDLREAECPNVHFEPRKCSDLSRTGNYCLKENFKHIAELFPEKGTVEELYREGSKPLLVIGWDVEAGCPSHGKGPGSRNDLAIFAASVKDGSCTDWDTAMLEHMGLCARAEGFVRQFISRYAPIVKMSPAEWKIHLDTFGVLTWQAWVIHSLAVTDMDFAWRKVIVVDDAVGNSHKSHFCDWFPRLMANVGQKVQVLSPGKLADMAHVLEADADMVVIDIPRSRSDALQWSFVEELKCGRVSCPKYNSSIKNMIKRPVRVLILCNEHPDETRRPGYNPVEPEHNRMCYGSTNVNMREKTPQATLSEDRWEEYHITDPEVCQAKVIKYELPPVFNFGKEFSSDVTGDGPVTWDCSTAAGEKIYRKYEESRETGDIDQAPPILLSRGWTYSGTDSVLSESIAKFFKSHGWDGTGKLEVKLDIPDSLVNFRLARGKARAYCMATGEWVRFGDPEGFVVHAMDGCSARIFIDGFGHMTGLSAIQRDDYDIAFREVITIYKITRPGHLHWHFNNDSAITGGGPPLTSVEFLKPEGLNIACWARDKS